MALELGGTSAAAAYVGAALASAAYVGGDLAWPEAPPPEFDKVLVVDGGDWDDPDVWSPAGVPGQGDSVLVELSVERDQNIIVDGAGSLQGAIDSLTLRPGGLIRFVGVDEAAFTDGGVFACDQPPATDIGLWVLCDGVLDVQGTAKRGWTTLTGGVTSEATSIDVQDATGWQVGDRIVIAPTEHPSVGTRSYLGFETRFISAIDGNTVSFSTGLSHDHPCAVGLRGTYCAEVMNLTRDVVIEGTPDGRSHIFMQTTAAPVLKHFETRHLGPRHGGVIEGRWPIHFHHMGDVPRGVVVEGVSAHQLGSHAYVAHLSNGVTFYDTVAYDVFEAPYWWDFPTGDEPGGSLNDSHDVVFDRVIGALRDGVGADGGNTRHNMFSLAVGTGNVVRSSVAVGVLPGTQGSGFHWPTDANKRPNVWVFEDNIAHNNAANGIQTWQNCPKEPDCAGPHIIDGFVAYHNGDGEQNDTGYGVFHGAYHNAFQFYDMDLFGNIGRSADESGAIDIHARPRTHEIESGREDGYIGVYEDFASTEVIRVNGGASNADEPALVRFCEVPGVLVAGTSKTRMLIDFVECVDLDGNELTPDHFTLEETSSDTVYRIQQADGTAWRLTDVDEDGVFEVESIPAFY